LHAVKERMNAYEDYKQVFVEDPPGSKAVYLC